jgi:hypothetical protein
MTQIHSTDGSRDSDGGLRDQPDSNDYCIISISDHSKQQDATLHSALHLARARGLWAKVVRYVGTRVISLNFPQTNLLFYG